jgi:hypothetical protein
MEEHDTGQPPMRAEKPKEKSVKTPKTRKMKKQEQPI